jgi:thiamine pyrophosphate-dependent acetolactate synthase large subunit-like protein
MYLDIKTAKIELIQWLTNLEDSDLIQKVLDLRKNESKDWWDEINEDEKRAIEKGIEEADKGLIKPQSEVRKIYEKWL